MLREKFLSVCGLIFSLFLTLLPVSGFASPLLVFDVSTGEVVHAEEAGSPWYPASLTKMLTAFVTFHAIREGKLKLDTRIPVSANAAAQPPSKIGLPVGSTISVDKALQALIVRSANDIAVVLGEAVAGGSEEQFVKLMNMWARKIGMTGSYFANPHGLPDPRQVTTARDMGLLAQAIIEQFPEHSKYFKMQSVKIGKRNFRARNSLLRLMKEADGMKTGFICASGYNLVASATRNGRRLVAVILGSRSGAARSKVAKTSLEKGFASKSQDGRKVEQYSNGGFFQRTPTNLQPKVCKNRARVPLAHYTRVRGWGLEFGRYSKSIEAGKVMSENLLALRNVVYTGHGTVVRDYRDGSLVSVMYGFDEEKAKQACDHLRSQSTSCTLFKPGTFTPPPEVIAERKRIAKERAAKRKAAKRAAAKKRAAKRAAAKKARAKKKAVKKKSVKKKAVKKKAVKKKAVKKPAKKKEAAKKPSTKTNFTTVKN